MSQDDAAIPGQSHHTAIDELIEVLGIERFRTLWSKFVDDTTARLATIDLAVTAGQIASVLGHLHTLKSTSATFGLVELSRHAIELEGEAKHMRLDGAQYERLRALFEQGTLRILAAYPELG